MKVRDFRLSSIWVEAPSVLLATDNAGRLGSIVRADDYANLFNDILQSDTDPLCTVPWSRGAKQKYPSHSHYWNQYILREIRDHTRADVGNMAWRAALPLRRKGPLVRFNRGDRCFLEGWYYPHGVALTATLWCRKQLSPDAFRAEVRNFLLEKLSVTWPDDSTASVTLNSLAEQCLDILRKEAFGDIDAGYRPSPHRTLTVVHAQHEPAETDQAAAKKALFDAAISAAGGDPEQQIPFSRNIYVISRNRVIWRPDCAVTEPGQLHVLGCLHRNVTMGTLQVASLLRAAEVLGGVYRDQNNVLPARIDPYAYRVGGIIARIHGGIDTYAQDCLRDQIAAANAQGQLNLLRQATGMPKLFTTPAAQSVNAPNVASPKT